MVILITLKCAQRDITSLILHTIWIQILWFHIVYHLDLDSLPERVFINCIVTTRFAHFIPSHS